MSTSNKASKRLKLGIVANEFFDRKIGRMGGFGWAAWKVSKLFNEHPEYGVETTFLTQSIPFAGDPTSIRVHGTRLINREGGRLTSIRRLRAEKLDLLLMIDYRPTYHFFAAALPRTPIIVWVRDPRTAEDMDKINTLSIPGAEGARPQGVAAIDCTSLRKIVRTSRLVRRPVIFATPAPGLAAKVPGTYGVTPSEVFFLPNIIDLNLGEVSKSARPSIAFLARLDPLKRPWLFVKLAEQFPEVDFLLMGQSHFEGMGSWQPMNLPANVRLLGHVEGEEKSKLLASSWVLVNTAISEGLAVSFLEALSCETPIISCNNPEEAVSRFGVFVGRWTGTGLDGLPKFAEALEMLLHDTPLRVRLGKEGRAWVGETHTAARFLQAFRSLCAMAGVRQP